MFVVRLDTWMMLFCELQRYSVYEWCLMFVENVLMIMMKKKVIIVW